MVQENSFLPGTRKGQTGVRARIWLLLPCILTLLDHLFTGPLAFLGVKFSEGERFATFKKSLQSVPRALRGTGAEV